MFLKLGIFHAIVILTLLNSSLSRLTKYNVKINETTVSGLSSGAFMAVQMHYAFSKNIKGCAVFAGGPYFCAQGTMTSALVNCMTMPDSIITATLVQKAKSLASQGKIDDISNLNGHKVYLYSGSQDSVVKQGVMKKAHEMYNSFNVNITSKYDIASEHCFPSNLVSNACNYKGSPYINNCQFNGAFEALNTLLGPLNSTNGTYKQENLLSFDQSPYLQSRSSMDSKGYIYVPDACKAGCSCKLHISFHGCMQTLADIGTDYVTKTGYLEIAEANNIIVLWPQAKKSMFMPSNPNGCWDWWGYTDGDFPFPAKETYATKSGIQMSAVWNMVKDIAGASIASELKFLE